MDLEGGGGAQPAAPEDPGGGVGVKAPHGVAQLGQPGGHPPDQGHGVARLLLPEGEVPQVHHRHAVVAGLDADGPAVVGDHTGDGVQVHAGGQAVAVLVVGVVAPQLRAAGGGEEQRLRLVAAGEGLTVGQHQLPKAVGGAGRVSAIDRHQPARQCPLFQFPQQLPSSHGHGLPPFDTASRVRLFLCGVLFIIPFYHHSAAPRKGDARKISREARISPKGGGASPARRRRSERGKIQNGGKFVNFS